MATLEIDSETGTRIYEVAFGGPLQGAPWSSGGTLTLATDAGNRPTRLAMGFTPGDFELQARLPGLAKQLPMALPLAAALSPLNIHAMAPVAIARALAVVGGSAGVCSTVSVITRSDSSAHPGSSD